MPRGDNPNSRQNLSKGKKFNAETARKANRKSLETKKAYASLTEALKAQCDSKEMEELTNMLLRKAKAGNLKAYELIRDQLGEKPTEKIAVSTVNEESIERLQKAISERRKE